MAAAALTPAASLSCPHGGTVTAAPASAKASAGAALLTTQDAFTIAGCSFTLPGPTPSPCVEVEWVVTDRSVRAGGAATLSTASVGLCKAGSGAPQGTVIISNPQSRVTTE